MNYDKLSWQGRLISVQPRIRLNRSFDQRNHSYLGYTLRVKGTIVDEDREFLIGIGKVAQAKHQFRIGDMVSGLSYAVPDKHLEPVEFYKTSSLKIIERAKEDKYEPPPWFGILPNLETYRKRGHRRLYVSTYDAKCKSCKWGCRMAVEMIIDHWNPTKRRYRFETFCYGPKSCSLYKAGPTRKVPGRKGMIWEEENWIDEEYTAHRSIDE